MAETLAEIRSLPDEELVRRHDEQAKSTLVGTNHYLQELSRRDQAGQTKAMLRHTQQITRLTWVITIATLANVVLVALTLLQ